MNSVSSTALEVFPPEEDILYDLGTTAELTGASRRSILIYCRQGLVHPEVDPAYGGWYFDAAAIQALRRIEYLRTVHAINLAGIRMILALLGHFEGTTRDRPSRLPLR